MTADILLCDAFEGLALLDPGSVDLVLSDLPSGETAAEFDHAPDLARLFAATWRALKPDGIAVFMASSLRFATACMVAGGKAYRYDLIWEKSRPTGHLHAKHGPLKSHEYVLVFSRKTGCYSPQMWDCGIPLAIGGNKNSENWDKKASESADARPRERAGTTERFPRTILRFDSVPQTGATRIHPQQKPVDLLRWLVRSYSRPGDLVVDPFAGSGSAGVAALTEGRQFMGFDSSARFAPRGAFA